MIVLTDNESTEDTQNLIKYKLSSICIYDSTLNLPEKILLALDTTDQPIFWVHPEYRFKSDPTSIFLELEWFFDYGLSVPPDQYCFYFSKKPDSIKFLRQWAKHKDMPVASETDNMCII